MSPTTVAGIAAGVAFALALYAVREAIGLKNPAERIGRWALLATAAGGGALFTTVLATLIGAIAHEDAIGVAIAELPMRVLVTFGVVLGLASVVIGPVLKDAVVSIVKRKTNTIAPTTPPADEP